MLQRLVNAMVKYTKDNGLALNGAKRQALALVQVAFNDVARSVVGHRREDHISIVDLLEAAKYLLLNQQVVRATAISAWSAYSASAARGTGLAAGCSAVLTCQQQQDQRERQRQERSGSRQGGWTRR
jgi:hypothetical protein